MILARRRFLFGAAATLVAAPAIVRAASLMPVKAPKIVLSGWYGTFVLPPASGMRMVSFIIENNGLAPITVSPGSGETIVGPGEKRTWEIPESPPKEWSVVTLDGGIDWPITADAA